MILIKVQCMGVTPPIIKTYFLRDDIDEIIFFNTFKKIDIKLKRNISINLDESIWFYSGYLIDSIRNDIHIDQIKKDITNLLSQEQLLIGVKEFLKDLYFEINVGSIKTNLMIRNSKFS